MRIHIIGNSTSRLINDDKIDRIVKLTCKEDSLGTFQILLKICDREVKNELVEYEFLTKIDADEEKILKLLRLK